MPLVVSATRDYRNVGECGQVDIAAGLHEQSRSSRVFCLGEELVRVVVGADDGGKQTTGRDFACVDREAQKFCIGRARHDFAAAPLRDICGGVTDAHSPPRCRSARRASSRSSKGSFVVPTIW